MNREKTLGLPWDLNRRSWWSRCRVGWSRDCRSVIPPAFLVMGYRGEVLGRYLRRARLLYIKPPLCQRRMVR